MTPRKNDSYNRTQADFQAKIAKLQQLLAQHKIKYRVTCTLRTNQEQALLYQIGRSKPGKIVTHAKPGFSPHNWSLARDYVILYLGKCLWNTKHPLWLLFRACVHEAGLVSGADWKTIKDWGHVESKTWRKAITWK
jgi:peptidoglycan L-alanyl-D-glutamate endopeptidase CwlK